MQQIHETLFDRDNVAYRVIKTSWYRLLIGASVAQFIMLFLIVAGLIDNFRAVEKMMTHTSRFSQRNQAINDILIQRTAIQQKMFLDICKLKGDTDCVISNDWWADPKRYPLIVNDEENLVLFPPKK